jgi:hypothetical protein
MIFAFRAICVVAVALSMIAAPAVGLEDPPSFKDKNSLGEGSGQAYDKTCVTCHSNLNPQEQHRWIGLHQASTFFGLVPHSETNVSAQPDIHAIALNKVYQNGDRNGPLTKAFESILGNLNIDKDSDHKIDKDSEGFRAQCLTCHAGLRSDQSSMTTPGRTYAQFRSEGEPIARESIGCEACHGQGKDYLVDHMGLSWLRSDPNEKLDKGFYDLENSALAARVCLSCHFGNPEESKWVTHEMYAAGHPPLPPLDLGKFLDGTSNKHWMTLNEKWNKLAPPKSDIDRQLNDDRINYLRIHLSANKSDHSDHSDLEQTIQTHFRKTQQSRIGQWTANLNYHDLLDQQARAAVNWGDYALYDCAGCHQTLYKKIQGSVGSPRRVPGRPQGPLWTKPMLSATGESQFKQLATLQELMDEALNAKPFGDRGKIQAAIEGFASERSKADSQLIALASEPLDPIAADQWLRGFLQQRQGMLGNRSVATQTYWTLEMYFDDLANVSKANPRLEVKNQKFQARFQELKSQAPDFFQTGSYGDSAGLSALKPETTKFYEMLGGFIDEFLEVDSKASR